MRAAIPHVESDDCSCQKCNKNRRQRVTRATPEYRERNRTYQQAYRANDPEAVRRLEAARKQRHAEWLASLKTGPCADCGVTYPHFVMDWDHRPDEEKLFALSKGPSHSREECLAEVAKCDLVCSNCHRYRTAIRGGWRGAR